MCVPYCFSNALCLKTSGSSAPKFEIKDKRQLEKLRKAVQKERDRLHLNSVNFNVQANNNKGKLQVYFRYRVDIDKELDVQKNKLFGQKMKSLHTKVTIYKVDFIVNNMKRFVDKIELNTQTHRECLFYLLYNTIFGLKMFILFAEDILIFNIKFL